MLKKSIQDNIRLMEVVGFGTVMIKHEIISIQGVLLPFTERALIGPLDKRYADVMLFKSRRRWWLHYSTTRCTGPFKTCSEAVRWFNNGGR